MERRRIGSLQVSVVGLGCNNFGWRLDGDGTTAVVNAAIESGVNFFDTADMYGGTRSEELLAEALGPRRRNVIIATKFGYRIDDQRHGAKAAYVRRAVEDSLRRLRTDYIDLYQLHFPDPETPIDETLGVLDELVKSGKVREIGCSNFSVPQLREAAAVTRPRSARFVSLQNQYSLLHREPEADVLPECVRTGLAFLPYFPLASGLLTGKYARGMPAPQGTRIEPGSKYLTAAKLETVERLRSFADSRGHSLLELAVSWLLAQGAVASVIAGATKPEQVRANTAAAGWTLTAADLVEIDRLAPRA
jgi:aryl-alcohol dehydrogenase-like predicted oxidoreductase